MAENLQGREGQGRGPADQEAFRRKVGASATRKLKARRHPGRSVWSGLGVSGLIGWSVVVPMLAGTALGLWLDKRFPGPHSWTLTLLISGLFFGCMNAWRWVTLEDEAMRKEQEPDNE